MSPSALQPMKAKRIQDAADLGGFVALPEAQVVANPGGAEGPHARFLNPMKRGNQWYLGTGFVEGTRIRGTEAPLPTSGQVHVIVKVDREIGRKPTEDNVLEYRTGRYVIVDAYLGRMSVNLLEGNGRYATTSRLLFTLTEDGAPPANYTGANHFSINPSSLNF